MQYCTLEICVLAWRWYLVLLEHLYTYFCHARVHVVPILYGARFSWKLSKSKSCVAISLSNSVHNRYNFELFPCIESERWWVRLYPSYRKDRHKLLKNKFLERSSFNSTTWHGFIFHTKTENPLSGQVSKNWEIL